MTEAKTWQKDMEDGIYGGWYIGSMVDRADGI